jgi:hypothetical protein
MEHLERLASIDPRRLNTPSSVPTLNTPPSAYKSYLQGGRWGLCPENPADPGETLSYRARHVIVPGFRQGRLILLYGLVLWLHIEPFGEIL